MGKHEKPSLDLTENPVDLPGFLTYSISPAVSLDQIKAIDAEQTDDPLLIGASHTVRQANIMKNNGFDLVSRLGRSPVTHAVITACDVENRTILGFSHEDKGSCPSALTDFLRERLEDALGAAVTVYPVVPTQ